MGLIYNTYLDGYPRIFACSKCKTHLSAHADLVSKQFRGQHGKAYLFNSVVNITESPPEDRQMTTGRHTVRDICCRQCGTVVGWKYEHAVETSEKYKEGKFILEYELLSNVNQQDIQARS